MCFGPYAWYFAHRARGITLRAIYRIEDVLLRLHDHLDPLKDILYMNRTVTYLRSIERVRGMEKDPLEYCLSISHKRSHDDDVLLRLHDSLDPLKDIYI